MRLLNKLLMRKNLIIMLLFLIGGLDAVAGSLFVEAESFSDKGGWVVDQQFTDLELLLVDDVSTEGSGAICD